MGNDCDTCAFYTYDWIMKTMSVMWTWTRMNTPVSCRTAIITAPITVTGMNTLWSAIRCKSGQKPGRPGFSDARIFRAAPASFPEA